MLDPDGADLQIGTERVARTRVAPRCPDASETGFFTLTAWSMLACEKRRGK